MLIKVTAARVLKIFSAFFIQKLVVLFNRQPSVHDTKYQQEYATSKHKAMQFIYQSWTSHY